MQQIPKIVRDRLKATSVSHHPDADVLTAFAEKALPILERGVVLEHLARCGECRDVVALALPEIEVETPTVRVRAGWLTWPALRWGFVAAGTQAIALVGTLQYQRHLGPQASLAKQQAAPEIAAYTQNQTTTLPAASAAKHEPASERIPSSAGATSPERDKTEFTRRKLVAPSAVPPAPSRALQFVPHAGAGVGAGPKGPTQWQQQIAPRVQVPGSAAPSATAKQQMADMGSNLQTPSPSQTVNVEVSGAAPVINTEQAWIADVRPPSVHSSREIDRAKAPVPTAPVKVETESPATLQSATTDNSAIEMPVQRNGGAVGRNFTQLTAEAAMPRWTISSTGSLQRSLDQGATWQDVDVSTNSAASGATIGGQFHGATSLDTAKTARAKQQYAEKKSTPAAVLIFRSVTANGPEVWAGGTPSALFHSVDAGSHWTRVLPTSAGVTLTGDIVSLQFADAQHGRILTSTAETWVTSDDGQTWQKQ